MKRKILFLILMMIVGHATTFAEMKTVAAASTELITPPSPLAEETWTLRANEVSNPKNPIVVKHDVTVGFSDDALYIQGLFEGYPKAWVKGIVNGGNVIFSSYQCIGEYIPGYPAWLVGTNLGDVVMTYDAESHVLKCNGPIYANIFEGQIYASETLQNITISAAAYEEVATTGANVEVPWDNGLICVEDFDEFGVIDANSDGYTWTYYNGYGLSSAGYRYNTALAADDWLFTPGIHLLPNNIYHFTAEIGTLSWVWERYEIFLGQGAMVSAMTRTLVKSTDLSTNSLQTDNYDHVDITFSVEAEGYYNIGVHAISDADANVLMARNFAIELTASPDAPLEPTDVTIVPAAKGEMAATISFTAPTKTVEGSPIPSGTTLNFSIFRGEDTVVEGLEGKPGQRLTYVDDAVTQNGENTYTVTPFIGTNPGASATSTAYIGVDKPQPVPSFRAVDHGNNVEFIWDEVSTEGARGGYVRPEAVSYKIYSLKQGMLGLTNDELLAEVDAQLTTTIPYVTTEGAQSTQYFSNVVSNAAGNSKGFSTHIVKGTPYELPYAESFAGGVSTKYILYSSSAETTRLLYSAQASDDDKGSLVLVNDDVVPSSCVIESGKVRLAAATSPLLSLALWATSPSAKVYVDITDNTGNTIKSQSITPPVGEFSTLQVDLAPFAGSDFIRYFIHVELEGEQSVFVDNIQIYDNISHNLTLGLQSPGSVVAGQSATFNVSVQNQGVETAAGYTVSLTADGKTVGSVTEDEPLDFLGVRTYSFTLPVSPFAEAADVEVVAKVDYDEEQMPADNTATAAIAILLSSASPVTHLVAEAQAGSIHLQWNAPTNAVAAHTEDFEDYEANTIVTDGEHLGPWTAYDFDNGYAYGWDASSGFNWDYTGTQYACAIMNPLLTFGDLDDFAPTSGSNVLMFMSVTDESYYNGIPSDDWIVSEALPGIAQTVTFQLRDLTNLYGDERYEVLYSTTDANPSSFIRVAQGKSSSTWQQVSVNLPEGARYFAIHYVSNNAFALFIDDVTYTPVSGELRGYVVYLDREAVAQLPATASDYTVADVEDGPHEVAVAAFYDDEATVISRPVMATVDGTDGVLTYAASVHQVAIFDIQGRRVQQSIKLEGLNNSPVVIREGRKVRK